MLAINKFRLKVCHYLSFASPDPLCTFFSVSSTDVSGLLYPRIQPMQKGEGHLEDGRTAESEFLFHRLFPAKLLQIYFMPRSEITIFPITTTYSTLSYNHHLPYPLGLSVITTVTTLRILYYLL